MRKSTIITDSKAISNDSAYSQNNRWKNLRDLDHRLGLKKSHRIAKPNAAPDFRREFLNKREMISVEFIG